MIPRWLEHARKDKGVHEYPGPEKKHPRIIEWLKSVDLSLPMVDETPHCSCAMNCWMEECGYFGTDNPAAISWELYGRDCDLKVGAIVVLRRGTEKWQRHVGICEDFDQNTVTLFSANVGNETKSAVFFRDRITAVRWPLELKNVMPSDTLILDRMKIPAWQIEREFKIVGPYEEKPYDTSHHRQPWYLRRWFKRSLSGLNAAGVALIATPEKTASFVGTGLVALTTGILAAAGIQDAKEKRRSGEDRETETLWDGMLNFIIRIIRKLFGGKKNA